MNPIEDESPVSSITVRQDLDDFDEHEEAIIIEQQKHQHQQQQPPSANEYEDDDETELLCAASKRQKTATASNISLMSCATTVPTAAIEHHLSSDAEEFISSFCEKRIGPIMYTTPDSKIHALVIAMSRMLTHAPETQFIIVCANNEQAYYTYWFVAQFGSNNSSSMSGMLCSFEHVNTHAPSTSNNYNVLIYTYACLSKHLRENGVPGGGGSKKLIFFDFDMCVNYYRHQRKIEKESAARQYVLDTNQAALFNFAALAHDFTRIVEAYEKNKCTCDYVFLLNQTTSEQACRQLVYGSSSKNGKRWKNIECVRSPVRNINELNHHHFYHVHTSERDEVLVNILNSNPNAVQILIVTKIDKFAHLTRFFETNWIEATFMSPFNFNFETVNRFSCQASIRTLVVTPQHANLPFASAIPGTCIANRLNVIVNYDSISTVNYVSSCIRFASIQNVYSIMSVGTTRDQDIRDNVNWRSELIH